MRHTSYKTPFVDFRTENGNNRYKSTYKNTSQYGRQEKYKRPFAHFQNAPTQKTYPLKKHYKQNQQSTEKRGTKATSIRGWSQPEKTKNWKTQCKYMGEHGKKATKTYKNTWTQSIPPPPAKDDGQITGTLSKETNVKNTETNGNNTHVLSNQVHGDKINNNESNPTQILDADGTDLSITL